MEDLTAGVMPDASVTFAKLAAAIIASQAQAEAGTASDVLMTPQRASQAIAALTPAFDYKKLVSTTTESAATTISVNLPDLTGYRQLKIKVFAKPATTSADTLAFRFNDISTSSYYTATTAGTGLRLGSIDGFSNGTYVDADIILNLNALELNGFVQSVYGAETGGKSFVNNQVSVSSSALAPASLSSINIFTTTYNIAAGAVIDVWGIK
jgi:hypothetical protein